MELRDWNRLQCVIMEEFKLGSKNADKVYEIGYLISHLRKGTGYEEALDDAREILKRYLY